MDSPRLLANNVCGQVCSFELLSALTNRQRITNANQSTIAIHEEGYLSTYTNTTEGKMLREKMKHA